MFFSWVKDSFVDLFAEDLRAALLFFVLSCLLGVAIFCFAKGAIKFFKSRRRKFIPERQVEFMLPDRENTYVRSRLATVLNTELQNEAEKEEELPLTFAHAKTLLHKLWFAPLSHSWVHFSLLPLSTNQLRCFM